MSSELNRDAQVILVLEISGWLQWMEYLYYCNIYLCVVWRGKLNSRATPELGLDILPDYGINYFCEF